MLFLDWLAENWASSMYNDKSVASENMWIVSAVVAANINFTVTCILYNTNTTMFWERHSKLILAISINGWIMNRQSMNWQLIMHGSVWHRDTVKSDWLFKGHWSNITIVMVSWWLLIVEYIQFYKVLFYTFCYILNCVHDWIILNII